MGKHLFHSFNILFLSAFLLLGTQGYVTAGGDRGYQPDKKKGKKTSEKGKSTNVMLTEGRAGLGLFAGFPVGSLNKLAYTGYGVNLDGEYFLLPELSVGLNAGYLSFKYDEIHVGRGHFSTIPIQLRGAYYLFDGNIRPYGGLNFGLYLKHEKYDSIIEPRTWVDPDGGEFLHLPGSVKAINNQSSVFGLSPMLGVVYKASDKLWLNLNTRYIFIMGNNTREDKKLIKDKDKAFHVIGIQFGVMYSFGMPGIL